MNDTITLDALKALAQDGNFEWLDAMRDHWQQKRTTASAEVDRCDTYLRWIGIARAQAQPDACQEHSDGFHYGGSTSSSEGTCYTHRCYCGDERDFHTSSSMKWKGDMELRDYGGDLL